MGESDLSDPEERYFIERLSTATRAGGRGSILTRDFDKKTARFPPIHNCPKKLVFKVDRAALNAHASQPCGRDSSRAAAPFAASASPR